MEKRGWLGVFCILIGIFPAITFLIFGNAQYILWFSNHTFLIIGTALLIKSRFWVTAQLCLGTIPELYWNTDFLYRIFTGKILFGTTEYMFINGSFNWLHFYSLQHLLFVPIGIAALIILGGPKKKAWIGGIAHGTILAITSRFISVDYNINCVAYPCIPIEIPYYKIIWLIVMALNVIFVYIIIKLLWKKKKLKKDLKKQSKYQKQKIK